MKNEEAQLFQPLDGVQRIKFDPFFSFLKKSFQKVHKSILSQSKRRRAAWLYKVCSASLRLAYRIIVSRSGSKNFASLKMYPWTALWSSFQKHGLIFQNQLSKNCSCSFVWNQCSPLGITVSSALIFSAKAFMVSLEVRLSFSPYKMHVGIFHEIGCSRT